MNDPNQLLTIPEAAALLKISTRSVWRLIHEKQLKARRILGTTRIARKDLDGLIDVS